MSQLNFSRGKFYWEGELPPGIDKTRWTAQWALDGGPGSYATTDLRAAAALRQRASDKAERVFDRAFQRTYSDPRLPPLPHLDAHQLDGLRWILTRKRSYLAHAPGAGKTAQAVTAACLTKQVGPALFIVPPSLTVNWEREILKFTEPLGIFPTIGRVQTTARAERVAWNADFLIVPDSMLTAPWVYSQLESRAYRLVAVDEASRFKDPAAQRSQIFYGGRVKDHRSPGLFQGARHVVMLDGSPMPNRPMELWAPTYALDPEAIDCMDSREYGFKFCGASLNDRGEWEFKHDSNGAELRERLQKSFMHFVGEEGLGHPERLRSLLFMTDDVRSPAHRTWERKHLAGIDFDELDEEQSQGDLARFRRELGERKVPWVVQYVRERLKQKGEQILIFAWHRDVCKTIHEALGSDAGLVIGGIGNENRERVLADFRKGKSRCIVGNIEAMARGHNLPEANRVIVVEPSWSDEVNRQAEKRASRRGSLHAFIRCEYVVCPGSMDEQIMSSLFTKQKRVRKIIG